MKNTLHIFKPLMFIMLLVGNFCFSNHVNETLKKENYDCDAIIQIINTPSSSDVAITWTSSATSFEIEYGPSGFLQGTGTFVNNITTNAYTISNLFSCTDYQYYIRANCGASTSNWVLSSFSTTSQNTTPLNVPFTQNFEGSLCEIGYSNTSGVVTSGSLSNNELKILSNGSTSNAISRGFYLTAGIPVQIRYRFKKVATETPALITRIGTNPIPFFQEEINFTNVSTTTFAQRTLNYLPTTTGVHYLSFSCTITNNSGVIIDDFGVYDCAVVPTVENNSDTSATINWIGTGTTYDIEYGLAGFTLGTGTLISGISGNSYIMNELALCSNYQVYIRSHCENSTSFWKSYPFSTLSPNGLAIDAPYITDFNTTFCDIGWTKQLGYFQLFNNALSIQAYVNSNTSEGISRGINLVAGQEYFIRYKYNNYVNSTTSVANLLVSIGMDQQIANQTIIKNYAPNGIPYTSVFQNEAISFTPTASGTYYVGFKTPSNNLNGTFLTIDDFSVDTFKIVSTSVTSNTGTINWFGDATSYDIEYGPEGFMQGSGILINNLTGNNTTISDLFSCSAYDFYIRPNYGTVNGVWVRGAFTTSTSNFAPLSVPFEENFDNTLCEIGYFSLGPNVSAEPIFGNNLVLYNPSGVGSRVNSRAFGLAANVPIRVVFKVARINEVATFGNVGISTISAINNPIIIQTIENPSIGLNNYTSFVVEFTPETTGLYSISFNLTSGLGLIFDDFIVDYCFVDINNNLIDTTSNSATLQVYGGGSNYDIEFGPEGFAQGEGTLLSGLAVNTYTINNLQPCTNYSFFYRSNCSNGDSTIWKTGNFSTLNNDYTSTNAPYDTTFDGLLCELQWKEISGNVSIFNVENNSKLVINSGLQANNENGAVVSRGINLVAGQTYNIGYEFANGSIFNTYLKVSIGTTEDIASQVLIKEYPDGIPPQNPNLVFQEESILYTPEVSGTYYIGFEVPTLPNQNLFMLIDDFSISSTLSIDKPHSKEIIIYPNPTNDIINISSSNENIKQINLYDMTGRLLKSQKRSSYNHQFNMKELPSAIYLLEVKTDKASTTMKIVKD